MEKWKGFRESYVWKKEFENEHIASFYIKAEEDGALPEYDHKGRLNEDWMNKNIDTDSEAYLCGPVEFMRAMYQFLTNAGVAKEDIYYELFQAGEDITQ